MLLVGAAIQAKDKLREINSPILFMKLPRPEPKGHRRMSMAKRAAQFMPFAALSGMMEMFEATRIEIEKKLEK